MVNGQAPLLNIAEYCHARGISTALLSAESYLAARGLGLPAPHAVTLEGDLPPDLRMVLWWHDRPEVRVSMTAQMRKRCAWSPPK
jgi:hypothetical protein